MLALGTSRSYSSWQRCLDAGRLASSRSSVDAHRSASRRPGPCRPWRIRSRSKRTRSPLFLTTLRGVSPRSVRRSCSAGSTPGTHAGAESSASVPRGPGIDDPVLVRLHSEGHFIRVTGTRVPGGQLGPEDHSGSSVSTGLSPNRTPSLGVWEGAPGGAPSGHHTPRIRCGPGGLLADAETGEDPVQEQSSGAGATGECSSRAPTAPRRLLGHHVQRVAPRAACSSRARSRRHLQRRSRGLRRWRTEECRGESLDGAAGTGQGAPSRPRPEHPGRGRSGRPAPTRPPNGARPRARSTSPASRETTGLEQRAQAWRRGHGHLGADRFGSTARIRRAVRRQGVLTPRLRGRSARGRLEAGGRIQRPPGASSAWSRIRGAARLLGLAAPGGPARSHAPRALASGRIELASDPQPARASTRHTRTSRVVPATPDTRAMPVPDQPH